ncbi:type VI secretion system baseplate subunit TssG [Vibrio sp. SM6]|uniref:Type VI secretion system baseplate subunit TssG n=2 Tax=Vibrio agarilyticus TaxID=2726741 RepID=A0A7X8TNK6_9VIBR|nr:type VI secretion system baseplate subunit TssG [Vibrio agarilyticus]
MRCDSHLGETLVQAPNQFEFIQIIRVLNALEAQGQRALLMAPEAMPKGAPNQVTSLHVDSQALRLTLGMEALSGAKGLIPDYIYAELLSCLHQDDDALQQFIDVFNQRYFELKVHAEMHANLLLRQEYEARQKQVIGKLSQHSALACLFSLPNHPQGTSSHSMIRHGLALANKTRSVSGLRKLLCDYFALDIDINVIAVSQHRIVSTERTKIGQKLGQNQNLGGGFWLGSTGTQTHQALEIKVIPKTQSEYIGLLSNRQFAQSIQSLAQTYLRESVTLRVYMYVRREYINEPQLVQTEQGFRLGEANCLASKRRKSEFRKILIQQEKV